MFTRINKSASAFLVVFLFLNSVKASELKIAVAEYPPFINVENGHVKGPVVQYFQNIFSKSFDKIIFVIMPSKRGVRELNKGTIDLFFPYAQHNKGSEIIGEPIFNVVPGICFKKANFIPILSAPGALNGLNIGIPPTLPLVPVFSRSSVNIKVIEGSDVLTRGIQLLLKDRLDGFYHPSPINVYHSSNPLSKDIACSLFYGYSEPINIALSAKLSREKKDKLKELYKAQMEEKPYEYYLLDLRLNL